MTFSKVVYCLLFHIQISDYELMLGIRTDRRRWFQACLVRDYNSKKKIVIPFAVEFCYNDLRNIELTFISVNHLNVFKLSILWLIQEYKYNVNATRAKSDVIYRKGIPEIHVTPGRTHWKLPKTRHRLLFFVTSRLLLKITTCIRLSLKIQSLVSLDLVWMLRLFNIHLHIHKGAFDNLFRKKNDVYNVSMPDNIQTTDQTPSLYVCTWCMALDFLSLWCNITRYHTVTNPDLSHRSASFTISTYVTLVLLDCLSAWRSVNALASHRCDPGSIPGVGMWDGHVVTKSDRWVSPGHSDFLPHEDHPNANIGANEHD